MPRAARQPRGRQANRGIQEGRNTPRMVGNVLESPTIGRASPPYQVPLPSVAEIVELDVAARYRLLEQFGLQTTWEEARADAGKYVSRMTGYQAGTEAYRLEVDNLVSTETKRGLLGNLRNAYREFSTYDMMEGLDPAKAEFTRIVEGDEASCNSCLALAAEEGTMAHHQAVGMPGSASCLGGSNCRCDLVHVD